MCNYLLLRKNFDLILIHKGGTGKTGSFQLAQLFAQLLGLLQNGDIVAAAQVCSLGKNGGEVGILAVQQGDLLLCAGDLVALLQQDAAHPLEADGEAHGGHLSAQELAHHVVVAAAAGHGTAELRAGDLKHHAGVVALTAHQTGAVGYLIAACSHGVGGSKDILEVVGNGGVCAAGSHGIQRDFACGNEVGQCVDGIFRQLLFGQLSLHTIGADGVKAELTEKQLPENAINALADFIAAGEVTLDAVAARCADPAIADDLKYVLATANAMAAGRYQVAYCPSLVRGQGYYTGMVFEITCPQFSGAVAGGGRYDNMVGKFLGTQVPAVGFSIGFERVCGILLEQGYQIPGAKQKIALLYGKDADFTAVLAKAADLRSSYNVTVLQQAKKLGKQLGQLEASGFSGAAFMDKDEIKIFAQQ